MPFGTGALVDPELIGRAQHGDEDAFATLALAVGGRLHAVAHRILRDAALAEDATQQALLAIWRDLPRLRDPERFEAWCYRVVVRACHAEGRRERQRNPSRYLAPGDDVVAALEDYRLVVDRDELERGFRRLSIDHRAVVVLHHYLDMPVLDVARVLGVPPGTVRSRLHHAMRSLRAALEADARVAPQRGGLMSTTERDVTMAVRSWLSEGPTDLPERVLDDVLVQLPLTAQRRRRSPAAWLAGLGTPVRIAAGVAMVVAIVFAIGILAPTRRVVGPAVSPDGSPVPSATVPATAVPDLTPPSDVDAYVRSAYERLVDLPPLSVTVVEEEGTKTHFAYDGVGTVRLDHFGNATDATPSELFLFTRDTRSELTALDDRSVWLAVPGQGHPLSELSGTLGLQRTCETGWVYVAPDELLDRPVHHVACGGFRDVARCRDAPAPALGPCAGRRPADHHHGRHGAAGGAAALRAVPAATRRPADERRGVPVRQRSELCVTGSAAD